jgi:hypothetical protein
MWPPRRARTATDGFRDDIIATAFFVGYRLANANGFANAVGDDYRPGLASGQYGKCECEADFTPDQKNHSAQAGHPVRLAALTA